MENSKIDIVPRGRSIGKVRDVDKVWLSQSEAKAYLDIKDNKTLDKLAREEMLEVSYVGRKLIYYKKSSIDAMFERHAVTIE